jgi:hypothetical protein
MRGVDNTGLEKEVEGAAIKPMGGWTMDLWLLEPCAFRRVFVYCQHNKDDNVERIMKSRG